MTRRCRSTLVSGTLGLVGWLVAAQPAAAQLPSLEPRVGEVVADEWVVERVEQHPEFVRVHFLRGVDEEAHVEVVLRAQLETDVGTEHFSLQAAPEGFAPEAVQDEVVAWLEEAERAPTPEEQARAELARSVRVSRVIALQKGLLAFAVLLSLLGAGQAVRERRRRRDDPAPDAARRRGRHALTLLVFTASGALLRVAQGPRTPGFEGGNGEAHGYGDIAAALGQTLPRLDPHGSGMATLTQLWFTVWPREEWALLVLQATLGIAIIPLVYLGALAWLRVQREATWAAAIYALLPCAAYFAMTEVRPVPGAFFLALAIVVTGAGLTSGRALLIAAGGLFAVFATAFHPVLGPAPLVLGLLWIARRESWPLLKELRVQLALATVAAAWAIMLRLLWLQLSLGAPDALIGGGAAQPVFAGWRVLFPSLGFPDHPFNAFLNTSSTPALIVVCWFAGVAGVLRPERRRVLLTLALAALGMTLPGMAGGRYNLARLQYAATPLHAMLAGVGCVACIQFVLGRVALAQARTLRRAVPAGLAIALGCSVAASPGPLSERLVFEGERLATLRAVSDLAAANRTCEVWMPPSGDGPYGDPPSYLTASVMPSSRWRALSAPEATRIEVGRSLRRYGCGYYFRPAMCWARRRGEAPGDDPTGLRPECAAVEERLHLTPLHVETIPARPAAAADYRRPLIEVGFFRVDGVVL